MTALMCCLFRSWSTRTPWIPAVPGPLACSVDGVVYQRSSTIGANAARGAALLARGAVIFWSTSEFLWIQIGAVGNHKKTKKTAISQDLPSQEFTSLQRKDETKHWISQAAPHGVAGVAISESPFPWQIHCEDMGVARMHGRLRLCRYKITMIRLWQIVMITFGWRLNSLGTQLNISQDVLGLCGRLESCFPLHAVASFSLKELTSCHKFLAKKHVNYAEQQLYRSHMRMSSSNASIICRQNMIQHCAGVQHHTQKSHRYPHRHWIRMIMLSRQHGRRLLGRCVRWMSSKSTEKRRLWNYRWITWSGVFKNIRKSWDFADVHQVG